MTQEQLTLDGLDLKDIGTQAALDAIPEWAAKARAAALRLMEQRPITSEDVTDAVGWPRTDRESNSNNAVGGLFSGLAAEGLIVSCGWVQARDPQAHARMIRKWTRRTVP